MTPKERTSMKRGIVVSTIVHVFVFAAVFFMPRSSARWDRVDAIPVDLVASVASRAKAQPAPPAPEPVRELEPESPAEAKPAPPAKTKEPATKTESKKGSAPRRIEPRRFQKISAPSDDRPSLEERVRQRLADESNEADQEPSEANEASPPRPSGSGEITNTAEVEATDFPYAWYLNLLRTKIADAWDPPSSRLLAGRSNQVIIRFHLTRDGSTSDLDVEVVSGAPGLDSSARRAVDRAQPFPPLPDGYPEDAVEIAVRFTVSEGR